MYRHTSHIAVIMLMLQDPRYCITLFEGHLILAGVSFNHKPSMQTKTVALGRMTVTHVLDHVQHVPLLDTF
jgi:hypothetical protein